MGEIDMKYLLALIMVFTACAGNSKPRFKVGDCIQFNPRSFESWENKSIIELITEVGHDSYHTKFYYQGNFIYSTPGLDKAYFTDNYSKVECPK